MAETERDKSSTTLAFPWLKQTVRERRIHNTVHFHQFLFYTCYVSLPFPVFIWSVWTRYIGNHLPSILFSLHCTKSKVVYLWGLHSIKKKLSSCDSMWRNCLCCWKELKEISWISIQHNELKLCVQLTYEPRVVVLCLLAERGPWG